MQIIQKYGLPDVQGQKNFFFNGVKKFGNPFHNIKHWFKHDNALSKLLLQVLFPNLTRIFSLTYNQPGPGVLLLYLYFIQYSQSDLPPLRLPCGETPGLDSNPG